MPTDPDARLTNLLGVVALAAHDRLGPPLDGAAGRGGSSAAALVHLHAHPGSSLDRLATALGISQPATVRAVDRLEADGLLRRAPGHDRRTLALELTPEGERRAGAALEARATALATLLDPLRPDERRRLHGLLETIAGTLAGDRPGAERACRLCDRSACASGSECPLEHTA